MYNDKILKGSKGFLTECCRAIHEFVALIKIPMNNYYEIIHFKRNTVLYKYYEYIILIQNAANLNIILLKYSIDK